MCQLSQRNQVQITREPGVLWEAPLASSLVPERRRPLPAGEEGAREGGRCSEQASLSPPLVLLEHLSRSGLRDRDSTSLRAILLTLAFSVLTFRWCIWQCNVIFFFKLMRSNRSSRCPNVSEHNLCPNNTGRHIVCCCPVNLFIGEN